MSRECPVTGKKTTVGNNVSHANNKTRRRFLPNLQSVSFFSEKLGRSFSVRVSTTGKRTVEHAGGLDAYLMKEKDNKLDAKFLSIKKLLLKIEAAAS